MCSQNNPVRLCYFHIVKKMVSWAETLLLGNNYSINNNNNYYFLYNF